MPSVPLYPQSSSTSASSRLEPHSNPHNALPPLLQTPSGLAILELQGTINVPASSSVPGPDTLEEESDLKNAARGKSIETELGKLMFPDYSDLDPDSTKWMKRVYLYAGRYQRMTGEVKKLPKPLAVIQRRQKSAAQQTDEEGNDKLEIVEIIKYKIIFASRPEPVGME